MRAGLRTVAAVDEDAADILVRLRVRGPARLLDRGVHIEVERVLIDVDAAVVARIGQDPHVLRPQVELAELVILVQTDHAGRVRVEDDLLDLHESGLVRTVQSVGHGRLVHGGDDVELLRDRRRLPRTGDRLHLFTGRFVRASGPGERVHPLDCHGGRVRQTRRQQPDDGQCCDPQPVPTSPSGLGVRLRRRFEGQIGDQSVQLGEGRGGHCTPQTLLVEGIRQTPFRDPLCQSIGVRRPLCA